MQIRTLLILSLGVLLFADLALGQHHHHEHDGHQLGQIDFPISCNEEAQEQFEMGVAQLHHMMYEQARPHFQAAAEADPQCAMAHWGIAMTSFQPLWYPASDEALERGQTALEEAGRLGTPTEREAAHIAAAEAFFTDPDPPAPDRSSDHQARLRAWVDAQRAAHVAFPEDVDAAAFYALAEVAYATTLFSPDEERDYTRQRRAGAVLERLLDEHPEHPGLFHYLIHAYDSPELAHKAEEVARGYDKVAPETVHALHMPSHIFVRLGKWEENVEWNERSAEAALRVWDRDPHASAHYVHALDYMMYGYLQLGDEENARRTLERAQAVEQMYPAPFAGYNLAAPQARYYLEQRKWEEAASLEPRNPEVLPWENYPMAEALFHYARGLGAAHVGNLEQAEAERERIRQSVQTLNESGNTYWAHMTDALGKAVEAMVLYERGATNEGLALMREAADLEDSMDKSPITPGEVFPVRELYGELLLREGRFEEARQAFEESLKRTPNRHNALTGLQRATAAR
jgi:tetratricopeptide (TPR) repeat protein